jgi:DNA-directed RNA polymerase subunit RPC12/RpoP
MKTILLTTCNNSFEANVIKGMLENNNIECFLTNEYFSDLMPHYDGIMGSGVQIMIKEFDLSNAQKLIVSNSTEKQITCPNCNSAHIQYELGSNKIMKTIFIFISLLFWIPFGNIKKLYVCGNCKTEFQNN